MQLSYRFSSRSSDRRRDHGVRAATILACLLSSSSAIAAPPLAMPDLAAVTRSVEMYFASLPGHQTGDLISRSQIEGALRSVKAAGWTVPNADEVAAMGLADNSFLIREHSSPAGRKFMRRIAQQPGAYARLDRLSSIPRGQKIVRDLIRQPGGEELVKYLASTKGGQNLGAKLAEARGGADLNKPTGRLYTANDLIAALQRIHENASP